MIARLRIAVADDEPDMRDYFRRMLPRLGHELVATAENGRDLVELCRALAPDLVITDLQMPVLDGLAALHQIFRQRPLPIVVVSAHADALAHADLATDPTHLAAYLVKPIGRDELTAAIDLAWQQFEQRSRPTYRQGENELRG